VIPGCHALAKPNHPFAMPQIRCIYRFYAVSAPGIDSPPYTKFYPGKRLTVIEQVSLTLIVVEKGVGICVAYGYVSL
jgi:hypothetical protein